MTARLYLTVYARNAMNGASLGTVNEATELEYRHVLHGTGAGKVIINRYHSQAALLVQDRYVRVHSDAGVIGGFFLEEGLIDLSHPANRGGEFITWSGRGQMAFLENGRLDTTSDITGGEDPIDGYWRLDNQGPLAGDENGHPIPMMKRVLVEVGLNSPNGLGGLDHSSWTYDSDTDSATPPVLTGEYGLNVGESALDALAQFDQLGGVVFQMSDSFVLDAHLSYGTDRSGAFGLSTVRFEKGVNVAAAIQRRVRGNVTFSHLIVGGAENAFVSVTDPDYVSGDVVRWGFLSVPETADTAQLTAAGLAHIELRKRQTDVWMFPQHDHGDDPVNGIYEPAPLPANGHYWVGDTVSHHTGTGTYDANEQESPVAAITWKLKTGQAANGDYEVIPEVGSTFSWEAGAAFESKSTPGSQQRVKICRDSGRAWSVPIEFLLKQRWVIGTGDDPDHYFEARARKAGDDVPLLTVQIAYDPVDNSLGIVSLLGWDQDGNASVGGSALSLVSAPSGVEFYLRFRIEATTLRARMWKVADAEPGAWHATSSGGGFNLTDASTLNELSDIFTTQYPNPTSFYRSELWIMEGYGSSAVVDTWSTAAADGWGTSEINGEPWQALGSDDTGVTGGEAYYIANSGPNSSLTTLLEIPDSVTTCIHGGPLATSGDASVACGQCVAAGNHEHDYVAAGGATGDVLTKSSGNDWETAWVAPQNAISFVSIAKWGTD